MRTAPTLALLTLLAARSAAAQTPTLTLQWPSGERNPRLAMLSLDADDDDDNGVPDLEEQTPLSAAQDDDIVTVSVTGATTGALRVTAHGGVRLVTANGLQTTATVPTQGGAASLELLGVDVSQGAGDASITVASASAEVTIALTVAGVSVLHGDLTRVLAHRDAVGLSHEITNNDTLPRTNRFSERSPDPDNLRVEVWDPTQSTGAVRIESLGTPASVSLAPGAVRGSLNEVELLAQAGGGAMRSRYLRLVGDDMDLRAPGVSGQTLLVGLRDRVRVRYRRQGVAGEACTDVRVGRPGNEDGPLAARRAQWHLLVLRNRAAQDGGTPLLGDTDARAEQIARNQVAISNEIYLQCAITWGDPARASITVSDPPPPSLLSVGDNDGFRALGGEVRLRVAGRPIGPIRTQRGWRPLDTALAIARAVRSAGFQAQVTQNERTDYGQEGSADVLVRDARGGLVTLSAPTDGALTTDALQSVTIGGVDFNDGVEEFNNLNSSSGTLEERTLVKSLMDADPSTVDLFMINRFTRGTRIGEAFVEGDSGAVINGLLLDRAGVSAEREAWTQSHEAGHIMLNQPWHPDNLGPDRPWLLMDADASLAAVAGPKRLTAEECRHIAHESGPDTHPGLLRRYDVVTPSPRAESFRAWPTRWFWEVPREATPVATSTTSAATVVPDPPARTYGVEIQ